MSTVGVVFLTIFILILVAAVIALAILFVREKKRICPSCPEPQIVTRPAVIETAPSSAEPPSSTMKPTAEDTLPPSMISGECGCHGAGYEKIGKVCYRAPSDFKPECKAPSSSTDTY